MSQTSMASGDWAWGGGRPVGRYAFEFRGHLAVSLDGQQVASSGGAVVLYADGPRGSWRVVGGVLRRELSGHFDVAQIVDITQPDAFTVVIRYDDRVLARTGIQRWQIAFRSSSATELRRTIAHMRDEIDSAAARAADRERSMLRLGAQRFQHVGSASSDGAESVGGVHS